LAAIDAILSLSHIPQKQHMPAKSRISRGNHAARIK
jgi:hypothetical protein